MTRLPAETVRELLRSVDLDLPPIAEGRTGTRLLGLGDLARRRPLGLARLVEAHEDAVSILGEAGMVPETGASYGVWASQHPTSGVSYDPESGTVDGTIAFASGLGVLDRALVSAHTAGGSVLVDVATGIRPNATIRWDTDGWSTPALVDTFTGAVTFTDHVVGEPVGESGWYLSRPGFWHGACAPAACWAGGAVGLVDAASLLIDRDPHRRAHHGALLAHQWTLESLLQTAGDQIDADRESARTAERVARSLRFAVAVICRDVLDRFGRAFGPRPYTQVASVAQRALDLDLYIKQHHSERELPAISALGATS